MPKQGKHVAGMVRLRICLVIPLVFTVSYLAVAGEADDVQRSETQLISTTDKGTSAWTPVGPAPIVTNSPTFGDLGNIDNTSADDPASGAIHAIAAHPTDADIIYIGSVNGGVWKTLNGTTSSPTWLQQTDALTAIGIGDIQFDPTDVTHQTLVAGLGRFSAFGSSGGARAGVIRTTDGGANWTLLGSGMAGRNVAGIVARGSVLVAGVDTSDLGFDCPNLGIFRSTDTGANWTQVTSGINRGRIDALDSDPTSSTRLYAGLVSADACDSGGVNGIYRSNDTGANWSKVSDAAMDTLLESSSGSHVEIAVGASGQVFVAIIPAGTGQLGGVFRSPNGNTGTWVAMDLPGSLEPSFFGIHPGGQGSIHTSLIADPMDSNVVYIGGDRQPRSNDDMNTFPNSIGAVSFSGRLFRGDASATSGMMPSLQWTPLTHVGTTSNSAPHADSRVMVFDVNGDILQGDDGGIFRRTDPDMNSGDWLPANGSLQVTEQHSMAYDTASGIAVSGNQDNGSSFQQTTAGVSWETFRGGDGGDIAIDNAGNLVTGCPTCSVRYASSQNLGGLARFFFDENNVFQGGFFLGLNVIGGGAPLTVQFVTPIAVNQVEGGRLLIGGGSLYESLDLGDTITEIGPGITAAAFGRNSIAYGASDNPELIYVARNNGSDTRLFQRTTRPGPFTAVFTPSNGQPLEGVVLDPSDSSQAFVLESARVFRTIDTGVNWPEVTGNLQTFNPGRLRSIAFMEGPGQDAVAVGADRGVFTAWGPTFSSWVEVGTGLPNAPVFDLDYDSAGDRLVAGTLGRGTHVLDGALSGNQPPSALNDSVSVVLGGTAIAVSGGSPSLLDNDMDPDGNNLILQSTPVVAPRFGSVTLNPNGTFSYAQNGAGFSADSFEYQVCDDGSPSQCVSAVVTITVDLTNAICSTPGLPIPDGSPTGVTDTFDVGSFGSLSDLNLTLDITHTYIGDLTVTLTHDGTGTSAVVIDRPDFPANPSGFGCDGANLQVSLDDEATLAAEDQCEPGTPTMFGTFTPNNVLSVFDGEDFSGNWSLSITDLATPDPGTLVKWCLFAVAGGVNQAPTPMDDSAVVDEGGTVTQVNGADASVLDNDTDPEMDGLTVTTTPLVAPSSASGFTLNGDGTFSYTHNGSETTSDFFQYEVCDDGTPSQCANATVNVTINPVNDPPVAAADSANVGEGSTVTLVNGSDNSVLANDNDPEMDTLTVTTFPISGPDNASSFTLNSDGTFSYTHDDTETSTDSFVYEVCDDGLPIECANGTLSITIAPDNDAPIALADAATVDEGGTVTQVNGTDTSVLDNDSDPEMDRLTVNSTPVSGPNNALSFTLNANGTFSYTHDAGESSSDSFVYEVCDDGVPSLCANATVSISIDAINDPPNAAADAISVLQGGTRDVLVDGSMSVLDNDSDAEMGALTVNTTPVAGPSSASSFTLNDNGTFSYTHDGLTLDPDSFTYEVCDDGAPQECAQATVDITVNGVNTPPVAQDDRFFTPQDVMLSDDVSVNDNDPDGPVMDYSQVSGPDNGMLNLQGDGSFTYTPNPGFSGTDRFVYELSDGDNIAQATVEIGVGVLIYADGFEE